MKRRTKKPTKEQLVAALFKRVGLPPPGAGRKYLNVDELKHVLAYMDCEAKNGEHARCSCKGA